MYVICVCIYYDKKPETYRIVAKGSTKKDTKTKVGFSTAAAAEAGIASFLDDQKLNTNALQAIFSFEGRRIGKHLMPKDEERVVRHIKMNKIAKRSFMRFKRMTGWDLLDCHDWVYDIDLRNVKVYEELRKPLYFGLPHSRS